MLAAYDGSRLILSQFLGFRNLPLATKARIFGRAVARSLWNCAFAWGENGQPMNFCTMAFRAISPW